MRQITNQIAVLAALVLLASACTDDSSQEQAETAPTGGLETTDATPDPRYTVIGETPLYGPGRWGLTAEGDPEAPLAVFDVPSDFLGRESFVWADVDTFANITYSTPTRVFTDPCDAGAPSRRVGPTVEDLATALAAKEPGTTTEPVATELGGYRALYLELTLSRRDLQACKADGGMLIWETAVRDESRALELPATDRYWILDLDGRRVVVTAMTEAGTTDETVELLTGVAETVAFIEAR